MGVDYRAKIVYGWLIEEDAVYDYKNNQPEKYDSNEYLHPISAYGDSDYVFGISIYETDYIRFIESDMIDAEAWDDNEDWINCWHQFKEDFPDKFANVKPGFFLTLEIW